MITRNILEERDRLLKKKTCKKTNNLIAYLLSLQLK